MEHLSIIEKKIHPLPDLQKHINVWRLESDKIVFTNGCFDILHHGHIYYLAQARDLGDKLIIGLNTDASIKRLGKDENRPINKQEDRAMLLAALHIVDAVVLFDEDTPLQLIEEIMPDVLVKGGDYNPNQTNKSQKNYIVGSDIVKANGGSVESIPLLEGFSTTNLIAQVKN